MNKIGIILRKELAEIFQQRVLLLTMSILPFLIVGVTGYMLARPVVNGRTPSASSDPRLAEMTPAQISQTVAGLQFRMLLLSQALLIPSVIAAYSIVGEKNNRTLERLLAAPIRTGQLLLAKSLAALLVTVAITWLTGMVFLGEIMLLTTTAILRIVATPGWLVLLFLTVPIMVLSPIAIVVMISSRVNDPRTASQTASLVFIGLVVAMALWGGPLVFSPLGALGITAGLVVLGAALLWLAARVFQPEVILTHWT